MMVRVVMCQELVSWMERGEMVSRVVTMYYRYTITETLFKVLFKVHDSRQYRYTIQGALFKGNTGIQ